MRLRFPVVLPSTIALLLLLAAEARADAPAKAPEVVTALPPVPLSSAQLAAVAAKAVPQVASARAAQAKPLHPVFAPPPASAYGTSAAATEKRLLHAQRLLPTISPSLGVIPRPEWINPFALKHADVAMIGGHPVAVPGTPAVTPAAVRR